jgi:LPXTG-site transpeptidase (sortase) family protein
MEDDRRDRNLIFFMGGVLLVCIIALVAVVNSIISTFAPIVNDISRLISSLTVVQTTDYNFPVEEKNIDVKTTSENNDIKLEENTTVKIEEKPLVAVEDTDYNFFVPEISSVEYDREFFPDAILDDAKLLALADLNENVFPANISIYIPKIKVASPVLQGFNSEELLNQGFWISPTSHVLGKGEVVLLCHRRHFGPNDPRSCWYLDNLSQNDEIILRVDTKELKYSVVGINTFDAEDPLIYSLSKDDDLIKIVTCTPLYSNAQRLVVLAKRQV